VSRHRGAVQFHVPVFLEGNVGAGTVFFRRRRRQNDTVSRKAHYLGWKEVLEAGHVGSMGQQRCAPSESSSFDIAVAVAMCVYAFRQDGLAVATIWR
jgi:hypothetical protein